MYCYICVDQHPNGLGTISVIQVIKIRPVSHDSIFETKVLQRADFSATCFEWTQEFQITCCPLDFYSHSISVVFSHNKSTICKYFLKLCVHNNRLSFDTGCVYGCYY